MKMLKSHSRNSNNEFMIKAFLLLSEKYSHAEYHSIPGCFAGTDIIYYCQMDAQVPVLELE